MRYLIDGHNLIGQLPDLSLSDPDDEAKLVSLLNSFCLRKGHRCTVVFDRGLPGGRSRALTTARVEVVFAHGGTTADAILKERIREARDAAQWTVISSDSQVREAARRRGMAALTSLDFGDRMSAPPPRPTGESKPQPSARDTKHWLEEFGLPPEDE